MDFFFTQGNYLISKNGSSNKALIWKSLHVYKYSSNQIEYSSPPNNWSGYQSTTIDKNSRNVKFTVKIISVTKLKLWPSSSKPIKTEYSNSAVHYYMFCVCESQKLLSHSTHLSEREPEPTSILPILIITEA